ncbi:N-acetylmuramoyl-L-alanine amidase [Nocardia sp. NPDC057440]|uniref:N-acetylmuramoyl-L-alanine amidase n=1 Tax=Nocardia sp. NPDC057440 TaxID=3346134 RepID=UPI00366BDBBA
MVSPPYYDERDDFGNSSSSRWGSRITNVLFHTQEGSGTAQSLADYLNNSGNGASYHRTIRDGVVVNVVPLNRASWSVLDANSYTINYCFAGSRASWSRDEWLEIEDDIKIACWLAVQDCAWAGIDTAVIAPPYEYRDGISDHRYVTDCLGIGTHTDVGRNFPWDVVRYWVDQYVNGGTAIAIINEIDAKADISPWLGKRITQGENITPDGVGRWAEFEHGYIYWSPATGAHPIPMSTFEKWAETGWERGPLGYPVTDHTELDSATGHGEVQGFHNGAIYRRFGKPGAYMHGEIRNRWNRSGFENGQLGWPVSDEIEFDGGTYQKFDNGTIYWPGRRSTVALLHDDGPGNPVADKD